jgi:hypothetical protein
MDDLKRYIEGPKKRRRAVENGSEAGNEQLKIGAVLRGAREEAGLIQD